MLLLDLAEVGAFVRFDAITMTRLLAAWVGEETLLKMAVTNPYFRRGCLGGLALAACPRHALRRTGRASALPLPRGAPLERSAPSSAHVLRARSGFRRVPEGSAENPPIPRVASAGRERLGVDPLEGGGRGIRVVRARPGSRRLVPSPAAGARRTRSARIPAASAASSPTGTARARSGARSRMWPTAVPTVGTPHAAASRATSGPASCRDEMDEESAPPKELDHAHRSRRKP